MRGNGNEDLVPDVSYVFCCGISYSHSILVSNHERCVQVILGTIVARCPKSSFVPVAMRDFNVAVDIFKKAAEKSERARIALVRQASLPLKY